MSGHCEGVCTSGTMGSALVRSSSRDSRKVKKAQKPLIFMRFHGVFLGRQHEIWSKQHNGKVSHFKFLLIGVRHGARAGRASGRYR
jgi:hypothetical protein